MEHFSSGNLVSSPYYLCSSLGKWNLVKRYFQFGMRSNKWDQIRGLILSPSLSEISYSTYLKANREMLRVPRKTLGNQSIMLCRSGFLGWKWNAIPEEEPQNCLNLSSFLALLINDLGVLGFLFWSVSPALCPSVGMEKLFLIEFDFQSTWPLHFTVSSGSFI